MHGHHALERALEDREATVRLEPDEEELRRLIRRERDVRTLAREPIREAGIGRKLEHGALESSPGRTPLARRSSSQPSVTSGRQAGEKLWRPPSPRDLREHAEAQLLSEDDFSQLSPDLDGRPPRQGRFADDSRLRYNIRMNKPDPLTKSVKLIAIGNSTGIVLPKELLDRLRLAQGDKVTLTETPGGLALRVYDPEFERQMEAAEKIMREDRDILRELAK